MRPLFSIGVTTYNRHELLRQTLASIAAQTFEDFEVIVGNDYTAETLSSEILGIEDPRIRFVNHPVNLGELRNLNSLLAEARGKYFTWQFDDDLYAPDFLQAVHTALARLNSSEPVFTSYRIHYEIAGEVSMRGNVQSDLSRRLSGRIQILSGRKFLRLYLSGKLRTMGLSGVYNTEHLRQLGGVESLCSSPFALYSEYLLLIRAGLETKIAYIDAPLVYFRVHTGSWGSSTTDVDLHAQAGRELVQKGVQILTQPALRDDLHENLSHLLKHVFCKFIERCAMVSKFSCVPAAKAYVDLLNWSLESARDSGLDYGEDMSITRASFWFIIPFLEGKLKTWAPLWLLRIIFKIYSTLRQRGLTASIP